MAPRHLDTFEKSQVLNADNGSANEKTGLLERQIQTWNGTEKGLRDHMIQRIRGIFEARIAREGESRLREPPDIQMMRRH